MSRISTERGAVYMGCAFPGKTKSDTGLQKVTGTSKLYEKSGETIDKSLDIPYSYFIMFASEKAASQEEQAAIKAAGFLCHGFFGCPSGTDGNHTPSFAGGNQKKPGRVTCE